MAVASVVLSIVVSAHEPGDDGHAAAGRIGTEIMVTESLGGFRNIARLIFLLAAADSLQKEAGR